MEKYRKPRWTGRVARKGRRGRHRSYSIIAEKVLGKWRLVRDGGGRVTVNVSMREFLTAISLKICIFFPNPKKNQTRNRENGEKYYNSSARIKVERKSRKR
jgi:hypothetical protein